MTFDVGVVGKTAYTRIPSSSLLEVYGFPGEKRYIPCNLKNSSVLREIKEYNSTGVLLEFEDVKLLRHSFDIVTEKLFDEIWTGVGVISPELTLEYYRSYSTAAGPAFGSSKRLALSDDVFCRRFALDAKRLDYSVRTISGACAKDELLPRHRVIRDDKQRAFISVSLYMILWQYHLFQAQNEAAKVLWTSGNSSFGYGFTKQYCGWDIVMTQFTDKTVHSTDFKRCDKTLLNLLFSWFYDYRAERLQETYRRGGYRRVATSLSWDLTRSLVVLPDGTLFVKARGNPSGQLCTTFDTIVVMHVLRIAAEIEQGAPLWEQPAFHYGDDTLMCGNVMALVSLAKRLGHTVVLDYSGPIEGAPFISHVIQRSTTGKFVGYGNIDKSIDRLRFTGTYHDALIPSVCRGIYDEQFPWYGTDEWHRLLEGINFILDERRIVTDFPSYRNCMKLYFSQGNRESRQQCFPSCLVFNW